MGTITATSIITTTTMTMITGAATRTVAVGMDILARNNEVAAVNRAFTLR